MVAHFRPEYSAHFVGIRILHREPTGAGLVSKKIVFSPASIDALTSGSIADPQTPGLAIVPISVPKKRWIFRRRVARSKTIVTMFGGYYPSTSIATAREWARVLNEMVEAGIDPRVAQRAEKRRATMSVSRPHELYMAAVHQGRSSRAKLANKSRTIKDKLDTLPSIRPIARNGLAMFGLALVITCR
jgi:hypothetical protein